MRCVSFWVAHQLNTSHSYLTRTRSCDLSQVPNGRATIPERADLLLLTLADVPVLATAFPSRFSGEASQVSGQLSGSRTPRTAVRAVCDMLPCPRFVAHFRRLARPDEKQAASNERGQFCAVAAAK